MRIFIDCTDTYYSGKNTGIQRVVRGLGLNLLKICEKTKNEVIFIVFEKNIIKEIPKSHFSKNAPPKESYKIRLNQRYLQVMRAIAVWTPSGPLRRFLLAHRTEFGLSWLIYLPFQIFTLFYSFIRRFEKIPVNTANRLPSKGDILFLADASWGYDLFPALQVVHENGCKIAFLIHDIIPIDYPDFCHPIYCTRFREWYSQTVKCADLLICNSYYTKNCIAEYAVNQLELHIPECSVIRLGRDLPAPEATRIDNKKLKSALNGSIPVILCVGSLEPRKNLATLISAFELLWGTGFNGKLVLIGREGWQCDDVVFRIKNHTQIGTKLHWFNDIHDDDLVRAYQAATALVFPSIVEGFGLPLMEALSYGLPVAASDIPVFHEIAGKNAIFFDPLDANSIASTILEIMNSPSPKHPNSVVWPTWEESSIDLLAILTAAVSIDT